MTEMNNLTLFESSTSGGIKHLYFSWSCVVMTTAIASVGYNIITLNNVKKIQISQMSDGNIKYNESNYEIKVRSIVHGHAADKLQYRLSLL